MKIGMDIDGVILDYERVLRTYGDLYDFIALKKDGLINRNEHYLRNRYDWTEEDRTNFIHRYFLKLAKQAGFIPGAKHVIELLQKDGHELIIISARGATVEGMQEVAKEQFKQQNISFSKYYWKQLDKLEVAKSENLDYMIDDNFDICKNLSENGIKTIYFRDKDMKKLKNNNVVEVSNWGEIYRIIKTKQYRTKFVKE